MSELCIDASVAIKWIIRGEVHRRRAIELLNDAVAANVTLIAPPIFDMETDSIIQTRFIDRRISWRATDSLLAQLDRAPVVIVTHRRLRQRAREIARRFNQRKVYDSTYAALADLRGCEFWTVDRRFYEAVQASLPFVRYLTDYA